jgi:hypothetical protein
MNSPLPFAATVHAIPGRTRLRIEARRGDDFFFASIATGLSSIAGVDHVEVRPLTGSVLIQHSAPLARIAEAAAQARMFTMVEDAPLSHQDRAALDAKAITAIGLGSFALFQLMRGKILPPAITLALYAASLGGLLHQPPEATDE